MDISSPDVRRPTPDSPSKVHMWILILLGWTAVFSLLSVGLLLTKSSDPSLSTTELSAACQNGVLNGITTNLTRISEACSENTDEGDLNANVSTYEATYVETLLPTFTLPAGWSTKVFSNVGGDTSIPLASLSGTKGTFFDCNGCSFDIGTTLFSITSESIAKAKSMDLATIAQYYKENDASVNPNSETTYSNISASSVELSGKTLVIIDGTQSVAAAGAPQGDFHILRLTTPTTFVEVTFYESDGATNDDWQTIYSSLDWSAVK